MHVAVLGAGTMGHGIAQVCAMAGNDVALADATTELAQRGVERVRGNLDEGVRRGKLEQAAVDACMQRWKTPLPPPTSSSKPCRNVSTSSGMC
jgi:3-hydroxybutyryl-CoA dehydrogenase